MKMPDGIVIKDKKTGTYFGFMAKFPGVWAQGDTKEEVRVKIEAIKVVFVKRLQEMQVEMQEEYEI